MLFVQQVLTACVHTFEGPAFGSRFPRSRLSPMTRPPLPSLHPLPTVRLAGRSSSGKVQICDESAGPASSPYAPSHSVVTPHAAASG
jgi:hypothetical protein